MAIEQPVQLELPRSCSAARGLLLPAHALVPAAAPAASPRQAAPTSQHRSRAFGVRTPLAGSDAAAPAGPLAPSLASELVPFPSLCVNSGEEREDAAVPPDAPALLGVDGRGATRLRLVLSPRSALLLVAAAPAAPRPKLRGGARETAGAAPALRQHHGWGAGATAQRRLSLQHEHPPVGLAGTPGATAVTLSAVRRRAAELAGGEPAAVAAEEAEDGMGGHAADGARQVRQRVAACSQAGQAIRALVEQFEAQQHRGSGGAPTPGTPRTAPRGAPPTATGGPSVP